MRISRRPNIRASIENAPGPSNAMTVVSTITLSTVWLGLKVKMTRAAVVIPIAAAAIGVMKPSKRQLAIISTVAATSELSRVSFSDPMYVSV